MRQLLVLALLGGSLVACHGKSPPSSQLSSDDARDVLIDRNWLDRMPETTTDRLHVYRFVPSMGGGVFQDRTLFKGTFELFMFKVERGDHIVFDLPETREKVTSQFTIENVAGPAPFDLKLTIWSDPRGPHVYFGMRAETDRDGHVLEQALAAKRAARNWPVGSRRVQPEGERAGAGGWHVPAPPPGLVSVELRRVGP